MKPLPLSQRTLGQAPFEEGLPSFVLEDLPTAVHDVGYFSYRLQRYVCLCTLSKEQDTTQTATVTTCVTNSPQCGVHVLRVWEHALGDSTHLEEDGIVDTDALDGYIEALPQVANAV